MVSCLVLWCLALSCLVLSCLALPCLALPCLALPCLDLSCRVLSCLSCFVLFCLAFYIGPALSTAAGGEEVPADILKMARIVPAPVTLKTILEHSQVLGGGG